MNWINQKVSNQMNDFSRRQQEILLLLFVRI